MYSERIESCGKRIAQALTIRDMTQSELAGITQIPKSSISLYLKGAYEPKNDRIYIIAKALRVSEAWLMGFDVDMERTPEQKKNDRLSELIVRMRRDATLFNLVDMLSRVPPEQLDNLSGLISGLVKE